MNPCFHQEMPILFVLAGPNMSKVALLGDSQTVLTVAEVHPISPSLVDHEETVSTTLQDKKLAEYEERIR